MSHHIQQVYIADGFADDCDELMHRCLTAGTLTFETFSDIWKEMQMSSIYHGRSSGAEIAELSEEVLHIAKHYMVADTSNFEESVAGLFLVYSLLNLQPYANFASLRIVQDDIPAIERIDLVARRDRRQDVLYVLGSVLIKGPVQYHAVLRERGMEYPIRKYLEGYSTIDKLGVRPKGVFYRQNAELDIIRELKNLTIRYTTAKENIHGVKPNDRNLNYLDANFANELDSSLKKIINGIIDDGDAGSSVNNCDTINNLKKNAMMSKVNPIRHRMGVSMRSKSNQLSCNIKSSPEKEESPYPTDTANTIENSNRGKKRRRKHSSSDSDDYNGKDFDFGSDDFSDNNDLDITKFDQAPNDVIVSKNEDAEQGIDVEIDDLPPVVSVDPGQLYEIEIIDNMNERSTSAVTSASTSRSESPDADNKRANKRDLKKTILKSRFKRMGMLPVANFQSK